MVRYGQLPGGMSQHIVWLRGWLLSWFERHGRSFPWREPGRSSCELAVAEILLQRTTAAGVARAFPGLVARYPTWEAIADAPLADLQEGLRPLGLWRQKARALLDLANVVEKQGGKLPCSRLDLERLPGIGPYTASELLAAVFGLDEPLVDVNMVRVLNRFFGTGACDSSVRDVSLHTLAFHLVRGERCLPVNWAVLDLGALVCRARDPLCQECPLREECRFLSRSSGAEAGVSASLKATHACSLWVIACASAACIISDTSLTNP
jgi:A/G-specific adenine glycosylase